MAMYLSSDISAADSEGNSSSFCCMHVVPSHGKVIPFSKRNFKKFRECADLWKDVNFGHEVENEIATRAACCHFGIRQGDREPEMQNDVVSELQSGSGQGRVATPSQDYNKVKLIQTHTHINVHLSLNGNLCELKKLSHPRLQTTVCDGRRSNPTISSQKIFATNCLCSYYY